MIGKTLQNGKYEIKRVLGQGGFGITYEGVQTGLGRKVAIKEFFMKNSCEREKGTSLVTIVGTEGNRTLVERFKEKFIKEAQMIASLEKVPHIIRIYDIFEENGTAYYVMEFIEGGTLDSKIKKEGPVNESIAIGYITQIADALEKLHEQRIMHLDIKPANILLRGNSLYLIDFGVSKHYDAEGDATTTTPVGISKGFAPIEQYRQGGVQTFSPETDIYSLGATAYFLVTGNTPPETTELIIAPIQRPVGVSDSLWNAIRISMNTNMNNRPHSIAEFKDLLGGKHTDSLKHVFSKINHTGTDTTVIDVDMLQNSEGKQKYQKKTYISLNVKESVSSFIYKLLLLFSCSACILLVMYIFDSMDYSLHERVVNWKHHVSLYFPFLEHYEFGVWFSLYYIFCMMVSLFSNHERGGNFNFLVITVAPLYPVALSFLIITGMSWLVPGIAEGIIELFTPTTRGVVFYATQFLTALVISYIYFTKVINRDFS